MSETEQFIPLEEIKDEQESPEQKKHEKVVFRIDDSFDGCINLDPSLDHDLCKS